ncbi:MAG: TRAP transporter large permease subunit, partial [Brevibacterium aurantiacum]
MSGRPSEAPPANPLPQTNVDELIAQYDEELPQRTLTRRLDLGVGIVCFVVSLFVLKQVFFPLAQGNQYYLMWFLAFVLPLVFICYRPGFGRKTDVADQAAEVAEAVDSTGTVDSATTAGNPKTAGQTKAKRRSNDNPSIIDWVLVALTFLTCAYPVLPFFSGGFNEFLNRQGSLTSLDVMMGGVLLLLVLEATRRTTGLILPIFCLVFFLYSYYGAYIPVSWPGSHAGQNFDQIVNALYNDASGFYGIPLDVAATYIVLFTIYGAVLDKTGAASFFIDLSFSLFKKSKAAPGRTVALSGFLLGTVSGSGTATAVSLGAVTWPVLKKAGYPKENAGGMLAASGIGAILSPPTLGAAAFIIAE